MSKYIETAEQTTLPIIALQGIVAFPGIAISFEISDEASCRAAEAAFESDSNAASAARQEASSVASKLRAIPGNATTPSSAMTGSVCFSAVSMYLDISAPLMKIFIRRDIRKYPTVYYNTLF